MKKKLFYSTIILFAFIFLAIAGCKNKVSSSDDDVKAVSSVRVTSISQTTISDQVSLSATSSFLIKDAARAIANGYIQNTEVNIGDKVKKGQVLFTKRHQQLETQKTPRLLFQEY